MNHKHWCKFKRLPAPNWHTACNLMRWDFFWWFQQVCLIGQIWSSLFFCNCLFHNWVQKEFWQYLFLYKFFCALVSSNRSSSTLSHSPRSNTCCTSRRMRAGWWRTWGQDPCRGSDIIHSVQTTFVVDPISYPLSAGGPFCWTKALETRSWLPKCV
jgi:hypothetical protein